ncbi:MAG: aldo/keto reductase [Actinobacteria bacterium]|nr:aldo/keto reductase [Actinomycetota bacterium]
MQYIKFGKQDFNVSRFGMGCMRMPSKIISEGKRKIDEDESIKMIRYAIDHGVNYFDTAYAYGDSELVVGKALSEGYREKVKLATKLPSWEIKSYGDFNKYLDEQLKRLQVEFIDIYLLHAMRQTYWENYKKLDVFKFLDEAKKQGKIVCAGFSFHDQLALFKEIVDCYNWDMCQIQLNYLDEHMQAGLEGLHYSASKSLPVVIMEPLKGGSLVNNLPSEVTELLKEDGSGINPVRLALRYLYSLPEATVILSGVSSMEQLKEDIEIFNSMPSGPLNDKELMLINRVRDLIKSKIVIGCTGCGYCMPCPSGVAIPDLFKLYNDVCMFNQLKVSKIFYQDVFISGKKDASQCTECEHCEEKCPQRLEIIKGLKDVRKLLG